MITGLKTQAVRLGSSYRLPVHILQWSVPARLGGDASFAEDIMAKYLTSNERRSSSVDFVHPKFGERDAGNVLSELSRQLVQLNRIRIQMNMHNYRIMQRYSLSVSTRCEQLLNFLEMNTNVYSGVSQEAVRELVQIHQRLKEQIAVAGTSGRTADKSSSEKSSAGNSSALDDESSLILKILTAASKGNGTRERYIRNLVRRMQSAGGSASGDSHSSQARVFLKQAESELFLVSDRERGGSMTIWMSEDAKKFFWKIQRAPEQIRNIFLNAGGFSSLIALEKTLKTMDTRSFHTFAEALMERVSMIIYETAGSGRNGNPDTEYGDEEWLNLRRRMESIEESSPGFVLQTENDAFHFIETITDEEWNRFRTELIHSDREESLKKHLPELYTALTGTVLVSAGKVSDSETAAVPADGTMLSDGAKPVSAAGAKPVSADREASDSSTGIETDAASGNVLSRDAAISILRNMDSETFRTVIRPVLERMTTSVSETVQNGEAPEGDRETVYTRHYNTAEMLIRAFAERDTEYVYESERLNTQRISETNYVQRMLSASEKVWESFCTEMIYADRNGELRKQAPELYQALVEVIEGSEILPEQSGAINRRTSEGSRTAESEGSRAAESEGSRTAESEGSRTAESEGSRAAEYEVIENIINTMDHETFRKVVLPLFNDISEMNTIEMTDREEYANGSPGASELSVRQFAMEKVFNVLAEKNGDVHEKDSFSEYLMQFFEQHSDEDWEIFRSELIYADDKGELRKELPELYEAFTDAYTNASTRQNKATGEESAEQAGLLAEEYEKRKEALDSTAGDQDEAEAGAASVTRDERGNEDRETEIIHQKELLFKVLREERGTMRILRTLIIEAIRNIAIIRENQREFMTLADSVMNLTNEQWNEFKRDVRVLRKEDLDIRQLIPETVFREAVSKSKYRTLEEDVHRTEENLERQESRQEILMSGIRMSAEKMELLRILREETERRDTVFTDIGRKLFVNTILRNSEAGHLIRPSIREMTSEGRESWRSFVTELLHIDRNASGDGAHAGTGYFGKLADQYGLSFRNETSGTGTDSIREAALHVMEQRRQERILDRETIIRREREIERELAENAQTQVFRLLPSESAAMYPESISNIPGQTTVDITVQRPGPNRDTAAQIRSAQEELRRAERRNQTEAVHDIEFETVRRTVSDQNNSTELKRVSEVVERHERVISGLLKAHKADADRDLPREVIRKINDRMRMERLRGGF